ncbi:MAG: tetratricopeptide repeat protein [Spirochaetaceae bacterium]|jgi:tetratricopeptide (TPR) repeat protein|nr:tetratricopeptide repeat protein [Spirochaetaceae bacterium]
MKAPKKTARQTSTGRKKAKGILKLACGVGVVLIPLTLAALIFAAVSRNSGGANAIRKDGSEGWYAALNEFDSLFARYGGGAFTNPNILKTMLDNAEENSVGAESRLSLLKRRRLLAKTAGGHAGAEQQEKAFTEDYYLSAKRAAADFPYSAPIAALACEALVMRATPAGKQALERTDAEFIARQTQVMLNTGPISEAVFLPLAFSFLALTGELASPGAALAQTNAPAMFAAAAQSPENAPIRNTLLLDTALLHILAGGTAPSWEGAASKEAADSALPFIAPLRAAPELPDNTRRFLANYYYDFGDMLTAGEMFSTLRDAESIEMAADALYLAGEKLGALNFWRLLSSEGNLRGAPANGTYLRALYNSASLGSSFNNDENGRPLKTENEVNISALEQLFFLTSNIPANEAENLDDVRIPALALYTRFLPDDRARALLENEDGARNHVLLDLELFKRNMPKLDIQKNAAETWLLLNRHPVSASLYQWAAWYFEYQKLYEDAAFLSHFAAQNGVESPALAFNESLSAMRSGALRQAGGVLAGLIEQLPAASSGLERTADGAWSLRWASEANLALIMEANREPREALIHYEKAIAAFSALNGQFPLKYTARKKTALILVHIARCYETLGMQTQAREALVQALALDADNIDVNLALRKL